MSFPKKHFVFIAYKVFYIFPSDLRTKTVILKQKKTINGYLLQWNLSNKTGEFLETGEENQGSHP